MLKPRLSPRFFPLTLYSDYAYCSFLRIILTNAAPEIASYEIVSEKEVKLVMNENVVLKNGSSGFEVLTESGYYLKCDVTLNGKVITVTSTVPFTAIRYGYNFEKTEKNVEDLTRTITIYDEKNLPCDMFLINLK